MGKISVSAFDTTDSEPIELIGGTIYLDDAIRNETMPTILNNIPIGQHGVRVKVAGYDAAEKDIEVVENMIAYATFYLERAETGLLEVTSTPAGAGIIIDLELQNETTPFSYDDIEVGNRNVSVFLDGYKTLVPAMQIPTVIDRETPVSVSFQLQQGNPGGSEGDIAFDFTLEDDYDNLISLHNYRGYIVLLTFFFRSCQGCMDEFPYIEAIYQDYSPYGVQVMGIDPMFFDNLEDVQFVRSELELTFRLLLDWGAVTTGQNGITQYPTNIVVGSGGNIVARLANITYDNLADILDGLLGL